LFGFTALRSQAGKTKASFANAISKIKLFLFIILHPGGVVPVLLFFKWAACYFSLLGLCLSAKQMAVSASLVSGL